MHDICVVLIEDHDLTRIGMQTALQQRPGIAVVAEAATGHQGLEILKTIQPDVAILDIGLPDMDGIEVTRRFKQDLSDKPDQTKILVLTLNDNDDVVLAAFAAGADSYCMKDVSLDQLAEAIRLTYEGNSWIDPAIAQIVLKQARSSLSTVTTEGATIEIDAAKPELNHLIEAYPLTERELEVLELIVEGCSNAAISERLYITVGTVKTHVRNILNKLCANDRTQAAVRALRSGLVG